MNIFRAVTQCTVPFLVLIGTSLAVVAGQPDYELSRFTVNGGGMTTSTGGNFELSLTIGQPGAGRMVQAEFELNTGFWYPPAPGDGNGDGVVNLDDYDAFEACLEAAGSGVPEGQCESFDTDGNGTIDLEDFAAMQQTFTGP